MFVQPSRRSTPLDLIYIRVMSSPGHGWRKLFSRWFLGAVVVPSAVGVGLGSLFFLIMLGLGVPFLGMDAVRGNALRQAWKGLLWVLLSAWRGGFLPCFITSALVMLLALILAVGAIAALYPSREGYSRRLDLLMALLSRPLWGFLLPGFPLFLVAYNCWGLHKALTRWGWARTRGSLPALLVASLAVAGWVHLASGLELRAWVHPWAAYLEESLRGKEEHRLEVARPHAKPYVAPVQTDHFYAP